MSMGYSAVTLSVVSCTPTDFPATTATTTLTNKSSNGTSTFILSFPLLPSNSHLSFMGGGAFCIKVCDPNGPSHNAAGFCQHTLDRIGCAYNAPNQAQNNVFEVCQGENQDVPGVYTDNGQTMSYAQPPEDQGAISTMPYTARIPASSNCVTYTSSELYAAAATAVPSGSGSGVTAKSSGVSSTKSGSGAAATQTGGSVMMGVSAFAGVASLTFAMIFLS